MPDSKTSVGPRVFTDLQVSQSEWWATRISVFRARHGRGLLIQLGNVLSLLCAAAKHDVVITSSVRNALLLGLTKSLGLVRRPRIVTVETRLDEPAPGLRWRLKVCLQRIAFRHVDVVCVSARDEIKAYSDRLRLPVGRFRFVPWHTNVLEPARYSAPDGYIFSAGRTGRDWSTFTEAVKGLACPIAVVCDADTRIRETFPKHATVESEIPYARYRQLLIGARIVVIPLEERVYSSGQVVILEAMALGKPVIATRAVGSADYINDGITGLLVPPNDAPSLRAAIVRLLEDDALADRLSRNALETVLESHTLDRYLHTIEGIAKRLALKQRAPVED
ncbi:MAG: glycosyltransferase family 4 protein [Steroidobacteraceae bacterium]|nr:glycosyltransferase family 4 protein [Steroidobacteraceae bacterium]